MTLIEIIAKNQLNTMGNKKAIYDSCKFMGKYIEGGISKYTKSQLEGLIKTLKAYKVQNDYGKFKFDKETIVLDNEQKKIVIEDINKNLRIIAGAGSGKTTTILCRIKYLIDNYIEPERILVLTFNIESCNNLKNKLTQLFGFPIKDRKSVV